METQLLTQVTEPAPEAAPASHPCDLRTQISLSGMERTPWWSKLDANQLTQWDGVPLGIKADGGGNVRGQGRVGNMRIWRATHNKNAARACVPPPWTVPHLSQHIQASPKYCASIKHLQ
jgi:hypothetical protein